MLAIINAHILTISQGEIENGTILVDKGKIVGVGADVVVPEDADIFDVQGAYVMPGLIDAHTAIGLKEEGMRWEGDDRNENTRSPIMPHLSALDGFNPEDEAIYDAMEHGITTVLSAPGTANVIGGQAAIFKMQERATADDLYQGVAGMKAALGQDPKGAWRNMKKMPSTRMGTAYILREALYKAKDYQQKLERAQANPEKMPERDLQSEALVKVLTGELPLYVHAHRADDMMTSIRIAKEFGLRLVFTTATEAHKLAQTIKHADIPVILGPISASRMSVETAGRTLCTPAALHEAGVKFALTTNHPETPLLTLTMQAGLAVRGGLCPEEALKAITLYPAEILGMADRVGSIEVGKDADLAIWDGHPLKVRSTVLATFVQGELVFELDCHCSCH
ncbi:MAG TPA: amidohydrolase [Firmicutes bacterium]|jgi:imidazolonepropionase-like amidohydrolase|nr:amidohydrolase [Bacillota bacterium]